MVLQLLWILLVQVDLLLIAGMTTIALACWQRPSIRSLPAIVSSSDLQGRVALVELTWQP